MDSPRRHGHDGRLPNLLVSIDLRDGEPTQPSLFALSEARRVAHVGGATVFAVVMAARDIAPPVVARLGRSGADKVLLCEGPHLGAPPLDATHGPALLAAVQRVPPLLVLFPAGGPGTELGPSLASRIGAGYAATADLEVSNTGPAPEGIGRVCLRRWRGDRTGYQRLDPVDIERPVVALLSAGQAFVELGTEDIDVEVIRCPPPANLAVEELASEPDEVGSIALASSLVVVAPALGAEAAERLAAVAPPGVAVVVGGPGATGALSVSAPSLLIDVGGGAPPVAGTPRGRVGVIAFGDGPISPRAFADVLWRAPAGLSSVDELGSAIADLGVRSNRDLPS